VDFDFRLFFPQVFKEGGFDIVIGNPPYVRHGKIKSIKPTLQKQNYEVFTSTADLYVYFYEKGYHLLKEQGILAYITSNKWMRAKYGEKLRKFLKEKTAILEIIDFSGYRVFEQTVDTNILIFRKEKPSKEHVFRFLEVKGDIKNIEEYLRKGKSKLIEQATGKGVEYLDSWSQVDTWQELRTWQTMYQNKLSDNAWTLGDESVLSLKDKIEKVGKPLKDWNVKIYRGVLTGYNDAFIIDTETRNRILENCKDEEERKRTEEIIKPVLRGRDIEKYRYKWAGLWIIGTFPAKNLNIDNYPALKEYLASFGDRLLQDGKPGHRKKTSNKWFETQDNIAYYPEFEKEKIAWAETSDKIKMTIVPQGIYLLKTCFILTGGNLKFIVGVANSKLIDWYIRQSIHKLGEKGIYASGYFMEQLPLPPITKENQPIADQIIQKVDQILSLTQSEDYDTNQEKQQHVKKLEHEIDQLVYQLYNLTEEEIKIIENT
jgi:type II restriction/modification system DNA methylase subunit YeeA